MSDLVGDISHLTRTRVPFNAVKVLSGPNGAGHFLLTEAEGLRQIIVGRASVKLVSDSLQLQVVGPPEPDKAANAAAAVIPAGSPSWPTTFNQILTIGGSAIVQHSAYVPASTAPLSFAVEVAHQIEPKPQVGKEPTIVYCYNVAGAEPTTESLLIVKGVVEVEGIGFLRTW
jgi:hypothetical protein